MAKPIRKGRPVSKDMSAFLDHLTGLSQDKQRAAVTLQKATTGGTEVSVWVNGCLYVQNGSVPGTKGRNWTIVECIA